MITKIIVSTCTVMVANIHILYSYNAHICCAHTKDLKDHQLKTILLNVKQDAIT